MGLFLGDHSRKLANWTIHLILFVSALKHTVLNQCSKARIDKVAALLGMLLNFKPKKIKFIAAYDSRGLSYHNFAN